MMSNSKSYIWQSNWASCVGQVKFSAKLFMWVEISTEIRGIEVKLKKPLIRDNGLLADTYVKTSMPQPAVRVKRRGPRSRAGFMAAPQLADIDMEMPRTTVATIGGSSDSGAGAFLLSFRGRMHNISMAVPTTYLKQMSQVKRPCMHYWQYVVM